MRTTRRYARVRGPSAAVPGCYTPAVLVHSGLAAATPVYQEVSDRARRAHRPPREATERPVDGDPPKRRRSTRETSIQAKPRTIGRGLFCGRRPGSADAGVAGCAGSLTHLGVRSLTCSPPPWPRPPMPPILFQATDGPPRSDGSRLMPATVIVGLQWGDEGKGKTTDFLAEQVAMVVRYQGGDNAGHTVVSGDEVLKLRLVPSGVLYPHITSVIGNGVVVNPVTLIGELDMLTSRGIDVSRVRVSRSAHVIMPYHVALDVANEARLDGAKVGHDRSGDRTDLRRSRLAARAAHGGPARSGGPARADRTGAARQEPAARPRWARRRSTPTRSSSEAVGWGERLRDHLDDTTWLVQTALARGEHVLLEGAQGTLLDLDHGSYPFVTSSNPVAGGACTGGGIGPLQVDEVIGVMKAYSTRVGSGPYPTELHDDIGAGHRRARPRVRDGDRPSATGRLVRCGARCAMRSRSTASARSCSTSSTSCRGSIRSGSASPTRSTDGASRRWPSSGAALARATPIYDEYPGWDEPINAVRSLADLPENARRYLSAIEGHAGVPIVLVSVGPGADPDDRAGLAPDAQPSRDHRMSTTSLLMPTRVLIVGGGGREHALAWKLGAEPGVNEVIVAPGSEAIAREPRVRCVAGRSARSCGGRRAGTPGLGRARRHRARGAAGGRCRRCAPARPGSSSSGRRRRPRGSRAARRSATRSRTRPGVRMARAATFTAVEPALTFARELGVRRSMAWSSRPTAWRPARA